jgi:hypothetical protein
MLMYKSQIENKMRAHSLQTPKLKCSFQNNSCPKGLKNCTKYLAKNIYKFYLHNKQRICIYIFI